MMASPSVTNREGLKRSKSLSKLLRVKSKSFKRIRGFLRGESRKDRSSKEDKVSKSTVANGRFPSDTDSNSKSEDDQDTETVYQVDMDRSVSPTKLYSDHVANDDERAAEREHLQTVSHPTASLQVILLLVDPVTKRFELLQLEFDSDTARVHDVLAQISYSALDDVLRNRVYQGISDRYGAEIKLTLRLASFCKGTQVFVAIPDGMNTQDCARLARPILRDENVIAMLRSNGIESPEEPPPRKKLSFSDEPAPDVKSTQVSTLLTGGLHSDLLSKSASQPDTMTSKESKRSIFNSVFCVLLLAVFAFVVQIAHKYVSSPLEPGQRLSPGAVMTKCGFLFFLPSCEANPRLEMSLDGILTMYSHEQTVEWQVVGGVCDSFENGCMNGTILREDGSLVIGGRPVSTVAVMGASTMSPWPFQVPPKLRIIRAKK